MAIDALLVKLMEGEELTQGEIRELRENADKKYEQAQKQSDAALAMFERLKSVCKHPNKKGYVCPDCGYNNRPDGY